MAKREQPKATSGMVSGGEIDITVFTANNSFLLLAIVFRLKICETGVNLS